MFVQNKAIFVQIPNFYRQVTTAMTPGLKLSPHGVIEPAYSVILILLFVYVISVS